MIVNKKSIPWLIINTKRKIIVSFFALISLVAINSHALETNIEIHKVLDAGTYGYSLGVTDTFFKQKAFNWKFSYNKLDNVNVTWNNTEWDMSVDTVDAMVTYRYFPRSYNSIINKLTFEFQAGAAVTLSQGRLIFAEEDQLKDIILSEEGDVNPVVSFLVYYKSSKETSINIGFKHYPDYSEYGDVSSFFVGFTYHFGRQIGY